MNLKLTLSNISVLQLKIITVQNDSYEHNETLLYKKIKIIQQNYQQTSSKDNYSSTRLNEYLVVESTLKKFVKSLTYYSNFSIK